MMNWYQDEEGDYLLFAHGQYYGMVRPQPPDAPPPPCFLAVAGDANYYAIQPTLAAAQAWVEDEARRAGIGRTPECGCPGCTMLA